MILERTEGNANGPQSGGGGATGLIQIRHLLYVFVKDLETLAHHKWSCPPLLSNKNIGVNTHNDALVIRVVTFCKKEKIRTVNNRSPSIAFRDVQH